MLSYQKLKQEQQRVAHNFFCTYMAAYQLHQYYSLIAHPQIFIISERSETTVPKSARFKMNDILSNAKKFCCIQNASGLFTWKGSVSDVDMFYVRQFEPDFEAQISAHYSEEMPMLAYAQFQQLSLCIQFHWRNLNPLLQDHLLENCDETLFLVRFPKCKKTIDLNKLLANLETTSQDAVCLVELLPATESFSMSAELSPTVAKL